MQGLSALPANCLKLCGGFFLGAMAISAMRDILPKRYARCVPIPMAAAIPFYIGAQLAVRILRGIPPRHPIRADYLAVSSDAISSCLASEASHAGLSSSASNAACLRHMWAMSRSVCLSPSAPPLSLNRACLVRS